SSVACKDMQSVGHTAAHKLQATQRSFPSGSRDKIILPRYLGAKYGFSSGYCTVIGFLNSLRKVSQIVLILLKNIFIPYTFNFHAALIFLDAAFRGAPHKSVYFSEAYS